MADTDETRERVDVLRESVFGDDISPGTEEMNRLLDYIRDQGYEIRRRGDADRHTSLSEFEERAAALIDRAAEIREAKNPEYSVAGEDYHNFFRTIASGSSLSVEAVCYILMSKHIMAVASWATGAGAEHSENMEGRFADLLNYTLFLYSLYREPPPTDQSE